MKQATPRKISLPTEPLHLHKRLREGALIVFCSLAIYLVIALITYHQTDTAWSHSGMSNDIQNAAGKAGAWFSDVLLSLFGYVSYIFPIAFLLSGIFIYREAPQAQKAPPFMWWARGIGLVMTMIAGCGLISLHFSHALQVLPMSNGGLLGVAIQTTSVNYFNALGASIILSGIFLVGVTLFSGLSWLQLCAKSWERGLPYLAKMRPLFGWMLKKSIDQAGKIKLPDLPSLPAPKIKTKAKPEPELELALASKSERKIDFLFPEEMESELDSEEDEGLPPIRPAKKITRTVIKPEAKPKPAQKSADVPLYSAKNHKLPSLSLLESEQKVQKQGYSSTQLHELSRLVESRLLEFGVEVKVVGVQPGPVVTRFEMDLAAGIKVSKITGLAKDLARSLSVISVRVVEVIPGKSVVGLEIPNVHRELVRFKAILEDATYQQATSPLSMALGKDISGRPITVDLAKMPHLLVAGTTGSGKSVGLNAMLLSLLYKATPEEVRLILIDPKMLELAIYDNIPHLLTPVVTDMKDAANALRWSVAEMDRRYQLMAAMGVRNLSGYNQKITQAAASGKPILDPFWRPQSGEKAQPLETLPYIVVVVDEFADMIMVVGKKVEELIARIAQKARAAGIHLILATQRPSVDVITGLIKANVPTRIAFQVSSRIDSRTILDQSGAEQLLGHGDMLYLPPGVGVPCRIHGAFVSDEEVHKVTDALRLSGKPIYIESVVQSTVSAGSSSEEELDELYDQAVVIVTESRKASISLVQRRLKIGYNRAARLVEQMEAEGVVSSMLSNGAREVLAPPPPSGFQE